jgi:hypothetical protein
MNPTWVVFLFVFEVSLSINVACRGGIPQEQLSPAGFAKKQPLSFVVFLKRKKRTESTSFIQKVNGTIDKDNC